MIIYQRLINQRNHWETFSKNNQPRKKFHVDKAKSKAVIS